VKIKDLIEQRNVIKINGDVNLDISGIAYNSRKVGPGYLFVAIPGLQHDGHDFIPEVCEKGAIAVVGEKRKESLPDNVPSNLTYIQVKQSRLALAEIANRYYDYPSTKLVLVGITGTNGKTTTSFLLESIFTEWGKKTGVIGTINYRYDGIEEKAPVTTPESLDLQMLFSRMLECGVSHAIMEVSSHALDLDRVHGCDFNVAVFTNLSQDHLDYHEDLEKYFQCKLKLFCEYLARTKSGEPVAVVNIDDRYGASIPDEPFYRKITYSVERKADIYPRKWHVGSEGIRANLTTPKGIFDVQTPLLGRLNLYNMMAAVGTALALGVPISVIQRGLARVKGVSGRLENVPNELGFTVVVDYAHTPDALEKALECVREITEGKLVVVFGCGGDRDKTKRPLMGRVAARHGDVVIITSDNPRSEDPMEIISDIVNGIESTGSRIFSSVTELMTCGSGCYIEPDRRRAIELAVNLATSGDLVYIGGKGHEDYQILADRTIHFDDKEEVLRALEKRKQLGENGRTASAVSGV